MRLSDVGEHGGLEGELPAAVRARVGLLLGVGLDVRVEVALLGEALVAEAAEVGLLPRVQAHVGDQVALLGEPLLTHLAGVGPVGLLVLLQPALVFELDLAEVAVGIRSRAGRKGLVVVGLLLLLLLGTAAGNVVGLQLGQLAAPLVWGTVIG